MKKVLLTATVQSHIAQFHKPLVKMLHDHEYEVHVAARNNLAEKNGLSIDFVDKVFDIPFARSPKSFDNVKAYIQLKKIIDDGDYEVVHCNTPMGGIVTRLAAIQARKNGTKVFYTAHGFHFFKGASKKNWIVFYPIERLMAHFCDTLITITYEDYCLAKKKFSCNVEHIHGVGVYTDRYHPVSEEEIIHMREAEGLTKEDFVILCVGELNENKNQKTLITGAVQIKERIPKLKILLAGNGPKEGILKEKIKELGLESQIKMLGYRTDLEMITPAVYLVVSCSFREGLPLNILEAELCKKPVIASINRGHRELIVEGKTGYKVKADEVNAYVDRICKLYVDQSLAEVMGKNGYIVAQKYTADAVYLELQSVYGLKS